jgi:murein tripeptide amidase MpaA
MSRRSLGLPAVVLAAAVFAPPAGAAQLTTGEVSAARDTARHCEAGLVRSRAGIAHTRVTAPARGFVRATLTAAGGDWDVAVYDTRSGRRVAAAAGFGATEVAEGFVAGRRALVVQSCRRGSSDRTAEVAVAFTKVAAARKGEKVQVLKVATPRPSDKARLLSLGVDTTEHGTATSVDVVTYTAAEVRRIAAAGFRFDVEVADLVAQSRRDRRADAKLAARRGSSPLPSGSEGYRHLADFESEMKDLALQNPGLVRPLTLNHTSLEGRTVHGIEITPNVNVLGDGKPVFLQLGVHHAREWPSAEYPMEFAHELVNGYGTDAKITSLLDRVRVIVVPVVNVDGYNLSREAPDDSNSGFAYKRKNCRVTDGATPVPGACGTTANRYLGTDPNRNYGGFWGGQGADPDPGTETYRGAGPFSEPEVQNVRELISSRQVTEFITNHTSGRLILRPPGVRALGPAKDEATYKAFGDAMARENAYTSQYGYQLYDTNGTAEDWSYAATGGYGFTFEHNTAFHPAYQQVIDGYLGTGPEDGKRGNRGAYMTMLEHAADAANHSVITGQAPAGFTLRLHKAFDMETAEVLQADGGFGPKQSYHDELDSFLDVPESGRFAWDVNPSTRPILAGRVKQGEPTADLEFTNGVPPTVPAVSALNKAEHPFTVKPGEDNGKAVVTITSTTAQEDFDGYLYKVQPDGSRLLIGSSTNPAAASERFETPHVNTPGDYVLVIENAGALPLYTVTVDFSSPEPPEAYTLTCHNPAGKQVGDAVPVIVDRGESVALEPCKA